MPEKEYALITGASSGLGEGFSRALAARGRNLIVVARSKEKLEALASELRAARGIDVVVIAQDLGVAGAARRLVDELRTRRLTVNLLVNNAGFGARGEFWMLPRERQTEMITLNVVTLVELTYLLVPEMVENRRGGVLNVSSSAGFQPVPYTTLYAATKAFVTSFSMALAAELRPYGVGVVTLCPGSTRTNFFKAGQYGDLKLPGGLQPPEEVVEEGLRALERGGGLVVPRLVNKFSVFSQRFAPRSLVVNVAAKIFRV